MSFERSVFEDGTMVQFLSDNWNISCSSYEKLSLGTANCFRIECVHDAFFLKEYQSEITESQIIKEANISECLQTKNIPSARFVRTVSNAGFAKYKGHYIVLEKYIVGKTCGYYDFPPSMLPEMAAMLAEIHIVLEDMQLPVSLGEDWVKGDALPKYDRLLGLLEEHREDAFYEKIKADLIYKRSILSEKQENFRKAFTGITYRNSHGDYQGCQIICGENCINAVIDFTEAARLPAVWEIMRSFIQTSRKTRNEGEIDIHGLCQYVKKYCEYAPLNENDISSMPYVYVYQLLRSTYGYEEYLLTDSEDRAGLIAFAFWRTEMCKAVLEHSKQIVMKLLGHIKIS